MMIFKLTEAGRHRLRKIAQRRVPGTLVLLLVAVRSAEASNCVLPAKDAGTAVLLAIIYIGKNTSSSVLFGVQRGNVQQPVVLEWELVVLHNRRKQAQMIQNWNAQFVQFVWSYQLILSHPASNFDIRFVELVSTRWSSVAVPLHMSVLCVRLASISSCFVG